MSGLDGLGWPNPKDEPNHYPTPKMTYTLIDTEDTIRPLTETENAAYKADGAEYARIARALLTRCFPVMTGREINACQNATGDFDTDEGFNAHLIDSLAIQYSKEISDHYNQYRL